MMGFLFSSLYESDDLEDIKINLKRMFPEASVQVNAPVPVPAARRPGF